MRVPPSPALRIPASPAPPPPPRLPTLPVNGSRGRVGKAAEREAKTDTAYTAACQSACVLPRILKAGEKKPSQAGKLHGDAQMVALAQGGKLEAQVIDLA